MDTPTWKLTLVRHDSEGQPTEELTLRGECLGELLGEAMYSGLRWLGDGADAPTDTLNTMLYQLTANWVTFQSEQLEDLAQVLAVFESSDEKGREDLRKAMLEVVSKMTD